MRPPQAGSARGARRCAWSPRRVGGAPWAARVAIGRGGRCRSDGRPGSRVKKETGGGSSKRDPAVATNGHRRLPHAAALAVARGVPLQGADEGRAPRPARSFLAAAPLDSISRPARGRARSGRRRERGGDATTMRPTGLGAAASRRVRAAQDQAVSGARRPSALRDDAGDDPFSAPIAAALPPALGGRLDAARPRLGEPLPPLSASASASSASPTRRLDDLDLPRRRRAAAADSAPPARRSSSLPGSIVQAPLLRERPHRVGDGVLPITGPPRAPSRRPARHEPSVHARAPRRPSTRVSPGDAQLALSGAIARREAQRSPSPRVHRQNVGGAGVPGTRPRCRRRRANARRGGGSARRRTRRSAPLQRTRGRAPEGDAEARLAHSARGLDEPRRVVPLAQREDAPPRAGRPRSEPQSAREARGRWSRPSPPTLNLEARRRREGVLGAP